MANPARLAQKTVKLLNEINAKLDVLLENTDISAKQMKELNEKLSRVSVYRSPKPNKGGGKTVEEVAEEKAEEPKEKKAKKQKPAQAKDESEE